MTTMSQRSSATVDGPRDNVFQREVPSFLEVSKFLRSLGEAKGSSRAKKQLYSSSCFKTTPACDGQMDGRTEGQTHDDSTYDAIRDAIVTCARKPT